jgi:hypothetical protein
MPRTKEGTTKAEREVSKLSEFGVSGGRLYSEATTIVGNQATIDTPLRSTRKRSAVSPEEHTPPSKKISSFSNQQQDIFVVDLAGDSEQHDESDRGSAHEINEKIEFQEEKETKKENSVESVERDSKFGNVVVIDYDRSIILDQHVVIPMDAFVEFLDSNFVCRNCRESRSVIEYQIVGIASSINWFCKCNSGGAVKARIRHDDEEETKEWKETRFARLKKASRYELNGRFVLGMQHMGCGERDASILAGMLDLNVDPMQSAWSQIEQEIGVVEINIGKQIVVENVKLEAELTGTEPFVQRINGPPLPFKYPITLDNYTEKIGRCKQCWKRPKLSFEGAILKKKKTGLSVQGDCRWDQRKGGRAYNSDSGTQLIVGNKTLKCIAVACMSKRCQKCEGDKDHLPEMCSKNYEGSSKGMEALGALRNVMGLFGTNNVYVREYVMDDDASTKTILKHSYKTLIDAGLFDMSDWPRYKDGKKKEDRGELTALHPSIAFIADCNHRVRSYAKAYFLLADLSQKKSECRPGDAERLKRNFAYFLHMYRAAPWEKFRHMSNAVVEHHFNNHEYCEEWCPVLKRRERIRKGEIEEDETSDLKYRSKTGNERLYTQVRAYHDAYTTDSALWELWHEVHSNKCESLNGFITKFLPKHKHYCRTIINEARTNVAISIDSIGYQPYYHLLFARLGIVNTAITSEHLRRLDHRREWKAKHDKMKHIKKRRKMKLNEKIKRANEQIKKDNRKGRTYQSGMAGPQVPNVVDDDDSVSKEQCNVNENTQQKKMKTNIRPVCKLCHRKGHKTQYSGKCLLSTKPTSTYYKPENVGAPRKFGSVVCPM